MTFDPFAVLPAGWAAAPDKDVASSQPSPEPADAQNKQAEPESEAGPLRPEGTKPPTGKAGLADMVKSVRSKTAAESPQQSPQSAEPDEPQQTPPQEPAAQQPGSKQSGSKQSGSKQPGSKPSARPSAAEKSDVVPPSPTVARPSRRDPLTADLEQEFEAAFGNLSLEQMMAGEQVSQAGTPLDTEAPHQATVVKVDRENVFLTIDGRNEGIAPLRMFSEPPEVGAQVEVIVSGYNAEDGLYELTIPGAAIDVADWSDLTEGMTVEARITAANSGGLECAVNNLRGFIPASQISLYRVENLEEFVDQKLLCVVTEANPQRQNLVLSHRAVLEREREEARRALYEQLEVGQVHEGVVRSLRDFGAFVDLGGVDGLIHISQLSWDRVSHPSEVLQEGQRIKAKIEKIDPQTGKISLSYRDLLDHPWTDIEQKFPAGTVVTGTVSRIAQFGAFVKLAPGIEGLIHISELAHYRVQQVSRVVSEGQEVQVKILSADQDSQRIALSLKAAQTASLEEDQEGEEGEEPPREVAVAKRKGPLKGGVDRPSGGDHFGLKW